VLFLWTAIKIPSTLSKHTRPLLTACVLGLDFLEVILVLYEQFNEWSSILELYCPLCATTFTILSSYSFIGQYMFRPNWPSSGVQDSAAHSNTVIFPPTLVASGYFGYMGYHQVHSEI
jgi:hypothetical protein